MSVETARLTVHGEMANCVADALSYYLSASTNNFGAGFVDEDREDVLTLLYERSLVAEFMERIEAAAHRIYAAEKAARGG